MTASAPGFVPLAEQQHLVLDHVSWDFYERVLDEVGNRPIRVTFDNGSMEIMPPLAEHEQPSRAIGALLRMMAVERDIPMSSFGSTTFRREDRQKGLEPDDCFYIANEARARGMKDFDPAVHPPPDLAIEIDITSRSVPREPVYAALGVPELWRYDRRSLQVLRLGAGGKYEHTDTSATFPFLPMREFAQFVRRMEFEEQTSVLRSFREWVRTLPT